MRASTTGSARISARSRTTIDTPRLSLRHLDDADATFIHTLLNDRSFLDNIGDRGVRTLDDARAYIQDGPVDSYGRHGFGLLLTERCSDGEPIGICGLLKRETLADPDVGFAFLPGFWRQGYAYEAARAVLEHARVHLGLDRVVAITSSDNLGSIRVLEKIGLAFDGLVRIEADGPELRLYAIEWSSPPESRTNS